MQHLHNYRTLVDRVDSLCREIDQKYAENISCHKGCDACCRHISLFPVEAVNLAEALRRLPEAQSSRLRKKAGTADPEGPCPLLEDGACLLYSARPIICRTHGLPILIKENNQPVIDFCPENFKGIESLPGNAVLDLTNLNNALTAINALFVAEYFRNEKPAKERLTVAEALLMQ